MPLLNKYYITVVDVSIEVVRGYKIKDTATTHLGHRLVIAALEVVLTEMVCMLSGWVGVVK